MVPVSVSRKPCRPSLARNEGDDKRKCDTTYSLFIMPARKKRQWRRRQRGGILPLAALIPALIAGGKAVALGAAGGAAGFGAKKALGAITRKKLRMRARTAADIRNIRRARALFRGRK